MSRLALTLALALLAPAVARADGAQSLLDGASRWEAQQRPDLARLSLEKLLRSQPGHVEATRRLVRLEIRSGRYEAARAALATLEKTHADDAAVSGLRTELRLATDDRLRWATARRLGETGRHDEAARAMRELFPDGPPAGDLALEYWRTLGRSTGGRAAARAALQTLARENPSDGRYAEAAESLRVDSGSKRQSGPDARALADAALAAGKPDQAQRHLERGLARDPDQVWVRYDLARLHQKLGRPDQARALMQAGERRSPRDADMHYAAALVYSGLDDDAAALQALAAIGERAQSAKTRELRQRLADDRARRHDGFVTTGPYLQDKPGSEGRSRYTLSALPTELRLPLDSGDWTLHVDPLRIDAGALSPVPDEARLVGQVQAQGAVLPAAVVQDAQGIEIGLAWERGHWRADLGSTPIGSPVTNVVGGLRYDDRWNDWSWRVALVRRPVTGNLLSFAGMHDPATGRVWGGVVRSGGEAAVGYYTADPLSASLSLGVYALTGVEVLDNDHQRLRLAADWAFVDDASQKLSAGLALMAWRYAEDLGEYTFGHGGYYSPQSYVSLSLPVDWKGRWQRLGWRLRLAVSGSRTYESAQAFYPAHPDLQALAASRPLPSGFSAPVYGSGVGTGLGFNLDSSAEYRATEHLFVGGYLRMDRSEYYNPDTFGLYLRWDFDGLPSATPYPPRPPQPYFDS